MNEPAQRCEEQIISLFQDRETLSSILTDNGYMLKECGVVGADVYDKTGKFPYAD